MDNKHEMNLFDLCLMAWRGCKKLCKSIWHCFMKAVRLTLRKWWIALPVIILFIAGAIYYSRMENRTYKVYAVATLNGPSLNLFDEVFRPLQSGVFSGEKETPAIAASLYSRTATRFETFPVIDCLRDSTMDYIDFKRKSKYTDTINWQMRDHICIQFRIKQRNLPQIPLIEEQLLDYLNGNAAMQRAYQAYMPTLDREVTFCHDQIEKLDSLTSVFYFQSSTSIGENSTNTFITNEGKGHMKRLFLPQIYGHIGYTRRLDIHRAQAVAPVVLASHFAINPVPVNTPLKTLVLFVFAGWILSLCIAWLIERITNRKSSKS